MHEMFAMEHPHRQGFSHAISKDWGYEGVGILGYFFTPIELKNLWKFIEGNSNSCFCGSCGVPTYSFDQWLSEYKNKPNYDHKD